MYAFSASAQSTPDALTDGGRLITSKSHRIHKSKPLVTSQIISKTRKNISQPSGSLSPLRSGEIFQHPTALHLLDQANAQVGTVTLVAGQPGSTVLDMAHDMTVTLKSDRLRVLALLGTGGEQTITDVSRTRGIDMGIATTLDLRQAERTDATKRIVYIAKLANAELHVLVRRNIAHLTDLDGQKVNLGEIGGSTQVASRPLLKHLGIRFTEVNIDQKEALARMRAEDSIAATFFLTSRPAPVYSEIALNDGFHFLPLPYDASFDELSYPAALTHADYPSLIPENVAIETVAVTTALIAFDWPQGSDRYRRISSFTTALFENFDRLREKGRHPKWREVNLAATIPGWRRFKPAQLELDSRAQSSSLGAAVTPVGH